MIVAPSNPDIAARALEEAEVRLAEARALEARARDAYAAAARGADPAAARVAQDRLSGIECAVARHHAALALARHRLRDAWSAA